MTDEELSALLRLKRYEQPPAEYFDQLLRDIHRRQRAELLRRPLWKIAVERVQTFFSEHSMGHASYAGAMAAVLVVGIAGIGLLTPNGNVRRTGAGVAVTIPIGPKNSFASEERFSIRPTTPVRLDSRDTVPSGIAPMASQPRYIMDARPVSYDPSSSFDF